MTTIANLKLEDTSHRSAKPTEVSIEMEKDNLGLILKPKGYGCKEDHNAGVVLLEQCGGTLRVMVYGDINSADPTHVIDLDGARLENYISPEEAEKAAEFKVRVDLAKDCHICEGRFVIDDNGVANHIDENGIDYAQDSDHVPYSLEDA